MQAHSYFSGAFIWLFLETYIRVTALSNDPALHYCHELYCSVSILLE